jgi:alkaline phosphatase
MAYVDGFVIPIAKSKTKAYLKMARLGAKIWKEYGALAYYECVGDDLKVPFGMGFPKLARLKRGETVVFSFIVYKSRAQRDKINAKVMKDPRMNDPAMMKSMPFDMKRFAMGGFKVLVSW